MEEAMPHHHFHLSDQELLMSSDGELPVRRAAEVKAHLDACWSCRARRQRLEEAAMDFVRARSRDLDPGIQCADGPRALLRARMAEVQDAPAPPLRPDVLYWRLTAAAACAAILVCGLIFFVRTVSAYGPRPNSTVTPGETRPITLAQVCSSSQAEVVRPIPTDTRRQVFRSYGLDPDKPGEFEVDYLITPDLGGADSPRNLWPQPYSARWNAKVKDRLEQRLHDLVCAGKVDLATAQHEIATDWIRAYKKYMGPTERH
jgi:hypothetical protein